MIKKPKAKIRPASTLLLALMVMSTLLITASSVSQLAALEAALSKNNNETLIATYAAESALEQGAYRARNTADTTAAMSGSSGAAFFTYGYANGAAWSRTASNTSSSMVLLNLARGLARGFDFFNSDSPSSGGKESVKVTVGTCDGSEWIEIGYQQFDPTTYTFGNFQKVRYNCPAGTNQVIVNNGPVAGYAYRLYVRYVNGNSTKLDRLTVQGCSADSGGGTCDLPGVVDITATGTYRTATRTMDLVLPRLSPVSGVFGYGVFSECKIVKDPTSSSTPACN